MDINETAQIHVHGFDRQQNDDDDDVLLQKPYIEIQIRRRPRDSRRRRAASTADLDCDETTSEHRCCRYPLTVDFREFGWDWVLAPQRFEAYYCSGVCTFLYYQVQLRSVIGTAGKKVGLGERFEGLKSCLKVFKGF